MITSLLDHNNNVQTEHHAKAAILWEAFKDRPDKIEFQEMLLDLPSLLQASNDLLWLDDPFTHEEIDKVISNLPSDK